MAKAIEWVQEYQTKVSQLRSQIDAKEKSIKESELKFTKDKLTTLSKEVKELWWLKKIMNYETFLTDEDNARYFSIVEDRKWTIPKE